MEWPNWWNWELEFTAHVLKRMIDRSFSEADLRQMLEEAKEFREDHEEGRWLIETTFDERTWAVILEPLLDEQLLLVITAYPVD